MATTLPFRNREDAAARLATALAQYRGTRPVVLAIPRGAVPMGRIIADAIGGELDVVLVRKLGAPDNPEFAIGAVDERGQVVLDESSADWSGASRNYVQWEAERQLALIRERRQRYRGGRPGIDLGKRTVIVVDDGLATGATMMAALNAVRAQRPARLVCAVPVGARDSISQVAAVADEVVCLATPSPFGAVGLYYRQFDQVDDRAVAEALNPSGAQASPTQVSATPARIPAGRAILDGELATPASPRGLVIFAHGSGSSRFSSRNRFVAEALNRAGFATLLFDLLTSQEDADAGMRFDISLLGERLQAALEWARASACAGLPIVLFGASTGAAAALRVAAARPREVAAVISRGGRPDLAGSETLARISVPTLLIVGAEDPQVLQLNRAAQAILGDQAELAVIPGATHLFEEPGALEQVAGLASHWLLDTMSAAARRIERA